MSRYAATWVGSVPMLIALGVLPLAGMAAESEIEQAHIGEDDLTPYIHQYMKSQHPDREIEEIYVLHRNGERIGYKVEYTPDSGKTVYVHPAGRPIESPPEK